jgi:soluble lytic murein transglycosylase-like protein
MKNRLIAGLLAAIVLGGASTIPAQAACKGDMHCLKSSAKKTHTKKFSSAKPKKATAKHASAKSATVKSTKKKRVHVASGKSRSLKRTTRMSDTALAIPAGSAGRGNDVVAMIQSMAPSHGVPTWFALRIAHVESNYKPHLRGAAGEYGVFQLKCSTAKGIGFSGNCAELLDARTNVKWGLKHLSLAIGKSRGNLKLAASKHNGGLYRRSLVPSYVAKVF